MLEILSGTLLHRLMSWWTLNRFFPQNSHTGDQIHDSNGFPFDIIQLIHSRGGVIGLFWIDCVIYLFVVYSRSMFMSHYHCCRARNSFYSIRWFTRKRELFEYIFPRIQWVERCVECVFVAMVLITCFSDTVRCLCMNLKNEEKREKWITRPIIELKLNNSNILWIFEWPFFIPLCNCFINSISERTARMDIVCMHSYSRRYSHDLCDTPCSSVFNIQRKHCKHDSPQLLI